MGTSVHSPNVSLSEADTKQNTRLICMHPSRRNRTLKNFSNHIFLGKTPFSKIKNFSTYHVIQNGYILDIDIEFFN